MECNSRHVTRLDTFMLSMIASAMAFGAGVVGYNRGYSAGAATSAPAVVSISTSAPDLRLDNWGSIPVEVQLVTANTITDPDRPITLRPYTGWGVGRQK